MVSAVVCRVMLGAPAVPGVSDAVAADDEGVLPSVIVSTDSVWPWASTSICFKTDTVWTASVTGVVTVAACLLWK